MFSHCLFGFADPYRAVAHAAQFLKPAGKILVFHQDESVCSELYCDPNIFSPRLTQVNHALTAEKIAAFLKFQYPDLCVTLKIDTSLIDVDEFVRASDDTRDNDVITFYLQAEYRDLSGPGRTEVHDIVMKHCDIVDGKYLVRHPAAAIIVSVACANE
jgi:hypothetical protein